MQADVVDRKRDPRIGIAQRKRPPNISIIDVGTVNYVIIWERYVFVLNTCNILSVRYAFDVCSAELALILRVS